MNEIFRELKEIDRTIHEPARLMIVTILSAVEEADFLYLLKATDLTKGNLSSHLSRQDAAHGLSLDERRGGRLRDISKANEESYLGA